MLRIQTFDARAGGNVIYKALAHPLAAEGIARLYARIARPGRSRSTTRTASPKPLLAMYPDLPGIAGLFVHDVMLVGQGTCGHDGARADRVCRRSAKAVLIAAFDAGRVSARIAHLLPQGAQCLTLDEASCRRNC